MAIRSRRWWLAVVALAAGCTLALGLTACGSSSGTGSSAGDAAGAKREAAPAAPGDAANQGAPAQAGGAGQAAGGAPAKVPDQLAPDSRSLIYTGTITVRVDDVTKAAADTAAAVTGAGGFVGGDERRSDGSRSEARLVLRVPSDKFASVIDAIGRFGHEENRTLNTQDVTEQVADVDARLANAQASVDRIRALMARAQTIGEITSLESELSRREGDLESLKARKRKLDDLTALSTVTAVLLGKDAAQQNKNEPTTGFLAGLKAGWNAFLASMRVLVTVLGALLPWLVALAVPAAVALWFARRTRRGRPESIALATPAGSPFVRLDPPATASASPPADAPAVVDEPAVNRSAGPPEDQGPTR